jgi:hypothetical protein
VVAANQGLVVAVSWGPVVAVAPVGFLGGADQTVSSQESRHRGRFGRDTVAAHGSGEWRRLLWLPHPQTTTPSGSSRRRPPSSTTEGGGSDLLWRRAQQIMQRHTDPGSTPCSLVSPFPILPPNQNVQAL